MHSEVDELVRQSATKPHQLLTYCHQLDTFFIVNEHERTQLLQKQLGCGNSAKRCGAAAVQGQAQGFRKVRSSASAPGPRSHLISKISLGMRRRDSGIQLRSFARGCGTPRGGESRSAAARTHLLLACWTKNLYSCAGQRGNVNERRKKVIARQRTTPARYETSLWGLLCPKWKK